MEIIRKAPEHTYVVFWKRGLAALLDCVCCIPFVFLYQYSLSFSLNHQNILLISSYYILLYAIMVFMIVRYGGTPGKLLLKIVVVRQSGSNLNLLQAIRRYIPYFILTLAFLWGVQDAISHVGDSAYTGMSGSEIYKITKDHNIFSNTVSIIAIIDPLCVVLNKRKRALHDFMAGSYVVYKKSSNVNI